MEELVTGIPQQGNVEKIAQGNIAPGEGILVISFYWPTLIASQAGTGERPARDPFNFAAPLPFRGSVVGLAVKSNNTKTTGVATFTATRNAALTNAVLTWPNSTSKATTSFAKGLYPFAANDDMGIQFQTDSSFLPTGIQIYMDLYLCITQSTLL